MNIKQKTAAVSTTLNVILTLLKFFVYSLTGSLAILAEAWHSLTDIITSLLVLVSVSPRHEKVSGQIDEENAGEEKTHSLSLFSNWKKIPLERRISFFIGIFILAAALIVIRKVIITPPPEISSPFLYGLIFIFFALGSYVVYKFETKIGKNQNSAGLIADGLHSKADMVGALIAGFSLILHQMGVNLDKVAAGIISIFIFSFALETFINFWGAFQGKTEWEDKVTSGLVVACFEKSTWQKFFSWLSKLLNWEQLPFSIRTGAKRIFLLLLALGIFIIIFLNCVFVVGPSQEAIRERLGKPLNLGRPLKPGLHFKLPWPWEKIIKIDSKSIRSMNIGNITAPRAVALLWTVQHGTEESFLSADNNFFYPYLVLHYRIKDIFAYTYNHQKPEELLNHATNRLISQIFSKKEFYDIATTYRKTIEDEIKKTIQQEMDKLQTGLELISVNTKDIHPPVSIAYTFEDVIAAMQERERKINQALGYRNSSLPEARGWAVKSIRQAEASWTEMTNKATGDAARFLKRYSTFKNHRAIATPMLYRQAMKEALFNKPLILIDPASGVPEIWMKMGKPIFLEERF